MADIFDRMAETYATFRKASPAVVDMVCAKLAEVPVASILEAGCGTADHVAAMARRLNCEGFGFDRSKKQLEEASKKHPRVRLKHGDADGRFPYPDEKFDFIISINLIHFVSMDDFFREVYRVAGSGGYVVTVTDTKEDIYNRTLSKYFPETIEKELGRYPPDVVKSISDAMRKSDWEVYNYERTSRWYPLSEFYVLAKNRAFSILSGQHIGDNEHNRGMGRLESDLNRGDDSYAEELYTYIWGRKPRW